MSVGQEGHLVCFEGVDGAGKTTTAAAVAAELAGHGLPAVVVEKRTARFPHDLTSKRMYALRELLWEYPDGAPLADWGDAHWLHLMAGWFVVLDRCLVRPLLLNGHLVVVDNWYHNFMARFLIKPDADRDYIVATFSGLSTPDQVLFLDVDPEQSWSRRPSFRLTECGGMDGLRGRSKADFCRYQERVRGELLAMASTASWTMLDGNGSPDAVTERAVRAILAHSRSVGATS